MKKYWFLFKSHLATSLEYRGALFTWILVGLVYLFAQLFLWTAIFRTYGQVGGYDLSGIISYYILVPLIGGFTDIFVSDHLPKQIKDGRISGDLMKPYSLALKVLIQQTGSRFTQVFIRLPIFIVVGWFFANQFGIKFNLVYIPLTLFVCFFAYILHFLIDLALSYASFWFDDVWSLSHLKIVAMLVFGGMNFPLDLVPENVRWLFTFLPFRFVFFFPIKVMQGSVSVSFFMTEFLQLLAWIAVFYLIGKVLWRLGLRKYGAYGN